MKWVLNRSLKAHLVTRFSLVLAGLLIVINAGFLLFVMTAVPDTAGVDENSSPVLAESIGSDPNGIDLSIDRSAKFDELVSRYPKLWLFFIADDGRRVTYGEVPTIYAGLTKSISDVRSLDIRGDNAPEITARLSIVDTSVGPGKLLYGGNTPPGNLFLGLLWAMKIIYLPFIIIPVVGVFLFIPFLVEQALKGLKRTTATASSISADSLGVRLSIDGVVEELHPLVAAINSALSRIDDGFSERQRFFANAAHELRTPIAILQTRLQGLHPGEQRDRLLLDAARLSATAEQLLDMQRLSGTHRLREIDLLATCERVAADLAPIAVASGYSLEFDTELDELPILGDEAALERAITNLVRNAIEHGGGKGKIAINISRDGVVEIADEGPGIPSDHKDRIFEPFYRVRPRSTGAGLGLSIVQEVLRAHCGSVTVVDQEQGACFRVIVPMRQTGLATRR